MIELYQMIIEDGTVVTAYKMKGELVLLNISEPGQVAFLNLKKGK